jgi:glyoxylase-like metal-dependent hydrolase (beta-lactamase superfamily II)
MFAIDPGRWLLPALRTADIEPESIRDVVLSHLHFDHAGGLTYQDGGRLRATFPAARVHAQRVEFEDARANFGVMTATYREENFTPIDALDAWTLHDGEGEIIPDVRARPSPGHTRGHQSLVIDGGQRTLVYSGDVLPTAAHVGAAYNMGYDLFPLDNRATKQALLRDAAERGWLLALDHEPGEPICTVRADGKWFALQRGLPG